MDIRDELLDKLRKEVIGPCPNSQYRDNETGEEILVRGIHGSPKSRYGAGMLYPQQSVTNGEVDGDEDADSDNQKIAVETSDDIPIEGHRASGNTETGVADEEPVGMANQYLPSAMGFTVRFNKKATKDKIQLFVQSAHYERANGKTLVKRIDKEGKVTIKKNKDGDFYQADYWIRRPIQAKPVELQINSLFSDSKKSVDFDIFLKKGKETWLKLRIFNRTTVEDKSGGYLTYTFVIINDLRASTNDSINSDNILYQNKLTLVSSSKDLIIPYKEKQSSSDTEEEDELNLLYRNKRIYAIGHGNSVEWTFDKDNQVINKIFTSAIPSYDLNQVAPTTFVDLSMLELSDKGDWTAAKKSLINLESEYEKWIRKIKKEAIEKKELEPYREAATRNVEKCQNSLQRIKRGIKYLTEADENDKIVQCFRWMNHAMIWQQQRSKTGIRKWVTTGKGKFKKLFLRGIDKNSSTHEFPSIKEFHNSSTGNGRWRPFQLAFILMNIDSIVNPDSEERKIVDLIWFPTGGGKTEAYLGLAAFNIFFRRYKGYEDFNSDFYGGTSILMRYTLRLLTTQQYERAASLICACELIRKENDDELGDEPISIGLWVGGSSTPNSNEKARAQVKSLQKDTKALYNFVVMKCPCCGAQIGKIENATRFDKEKVKGLTFDDGKGGHVRFKCENAFCEFYDVYLPLQVVDEIIYANPPTLLLGTVDKFAMVTWRQDAGRLFGFRYDKEGIKTRIHPPELIIQDELHLIAGPLGTMVGLYETMIQTLCNCYKKNEAPFILENDSFIPPKIIASSATISRAYEQVRSLYAISSKDQLNIFPSQGLDFGNTWFSEEKSLEIRDENLNQKFPGRRYVGVLASGYPSAQTSIVRSYASVLQALKEIENTENSDQINYYWTLLGYFNSIRELGGASSLVYGDIRERLSQIQNRELISKKNKRYINRIEELTSRVSSSDIPATLKKLEESFATEKNRALDICLATNMVATGVDISRLGLMFIHGQPKTTAEYIQASSRVGRRLPEGPGIIFTLYSPSKPRDKSQYEQFQGYHSRIYSNVEPTSVTPFSVNAREKGLHAVLFGLIRHLSNGSLDKNPNPSSSEFDRLAGIVSRIIMERCDVVDKSEKAATQILLDRRIKFCKDRGFQLYGDAGNSFNRQKDLNPPLMYSTSTEVKEEIIIENRSLGTPTSMRGVDTESVLSIYSNTDQNGE